MKLIIWLWNPWSEYKNTRHNIGFLFLDYLKEKSSFWDFMKEKKFVWEIATWDIDSEKVILLKPQTFMNLSWESIRKLIDFYKIDINDIIVIYDDMSLEFWKIRFRDIWSAGWHNWIKSIIAHIWNNFKRIKVWIWFNSNYEVSDWVLSKFTFEELEELNEAVFWKVFRQMIEKL